MWTSWDVSQSAFSCRVRTVSVVSCDLSLRQVDPLPGTSKVTWIADILCKCCFFSPVRHSVIAGVSKMRAVHVNSYTIYFCESPLREIIDCRERGPGFERLQGRTLPRQSPVTPHWWQRLGLKQRGCSSSERTPPTANPEVDWRLHIEWHSVYLRGWYRACRRPTVTAYVYLYVLGIGPAGARQWQRIPTW